MKQGVQTHETTGGAVMRPSKPFATLSIIVLALIALGHVLRMVFRWEAVVNGTSIPVWISAVPALFLGGLAFMLWRESRGDKDVDHKGL
jgi:hypothetical protein